MASHHDEEFDDELLEFFPEERTSNKLRKKGDDIEKEKRIVPLKKRLQQKEPSPVPSEEGSAQSSDESSEGDGMDDDLYMGDEDREQLFSLPEAQREKILYERAEKRKDLLERKRIRRAKRDSKRQTKESQRKRQDTHRPPPKATRGNTKTSALDDIKARRNQANTKSKRRYRDDDDDEYQDPDDGGDDDSDDQDDNDTEFHHPLPADDEKEEEKPDPLSTPPQEEESVPEDLKFGDVLPAVVKRSQLEKWYGEPYWEKAVQGLFVRAIIGQVKDGRVYRIAEIMHLVDSNSTYKLGKKECNQLVTLKIGDKTKNFEMKYLSNEPPTEEEFQRWLKWNQKLNEPPPTRAHLEKLKIQVSMADSYVWSEEEVARQVKKNRENSSTPVNFTKERMRIIQMIDHETNAGNKEKINMLQSQLRELDMKDYEMLKRMESKMSLKNVNKRNAQDDIENVQKAKLQKQRSKSSEIDPYARRSTRVGISWMGLSKKRKEGEKQGGEAEMKANTTPEPALKKQKLNSGKITAKKIFDVDFDIDTPKSLTIRESLLKPISTPMLPSQTISPQVKTLSLSDYKRNKGLE